MLVVMTWGESDNLFFVSFRSLGEAKAAYPKFRFKDDYWYYEGEEIKFAVGSAIRFVWTEQPRRGIIGCFDTDNKEHLHHMARAIMLATRQR